jgi:hypothetical protein
MPQTVGDGPFTIADRDRLLFGDPDLRESEELLRLYGCEVTILVKCAITKVLVRSSSIG